MSQFTHLHVHTQYSILDGASNIKKLIARALELNMSSIAITDHGNMFGVKQFHELANKMGIKPILGCEVYVARRGRKRQEEKIDARGHHLILLAKNLRGYHNLIKIVSYSWLEGYYYTPRIDKELLEQYHEDIICCSACIGGEIPKLIIAGDIEGAEKTAMWFKNLFGDDFYLELQIHKSGRPIQDSFVYENQLIVNKELLRIGDKLGIKCIASNDIHFVNAEDATAHDHLICLNTRKNLDDPKRIRYSGMEYLKSADEMLALFPHNPELLTNTMEISDKIEEYSLSHSAFMPDFPLPEDFEVPVKRFKEVLINSLDVFAEKKKDDNITLQSKEIDTAINACNTESEVSDLLLNSGDKWDATFDLVERRAIARQYIYLEYITFLGAKERYGDDMSDSTRERIVFELSIIERMGFPGYFLIVWDFIAAGRRMGVSVGPGRGSAAGSVVAYCLKITNIDPIRYDLLFERFLNPERISMPDIDIDFDEDGREEVMKYVVLKYGATRVAHIITFGKMGAKNSIRDVARVQQLPLPESNRLSKLVPEKPGTTLADAFKEVKELSDERTSSNELIRNTLKYAETLEGSVRQTGVHACGVIIAKDDLENYVPVSTNDGAELFVVQYDGHFVEDIGLLKMDFLGLKTLSIIKDAVRNVKISKGIDVDIDSIALDDALTFELYSIGNTTGIFQFESPGMKKHLRSLKPNKFEDLIAMNALYRPGPMEYIPSFIDRKHGKEPIKYDIDDMQEYLENTYGITVYQEQVMLLSQKLAGFTKGQADTLRKAMGKKQRDVLDKMKGTFISGATSKGYDEKICEKIWGDWEAFASYAFNKSHSTCYAYVSYQTAYMKAHYPSEFMAAVLSRNFSDIKKIAFFMDECRNMGLNVKGPDVNKSRLEFSVDKEGVVRFGISAIKGVGTAATDAIILERETNGEYKDLLDFIERIDQRTVGKKTLENLISAGAFDSLTGFHRALFTYIREGEKDSFLERWTNYGAMYRNEMQQATQSLFGGFEDTIDMIKKPELPTNGNEAFSQIETLNKEKELIGMYVSAHPLDNYRHIIKSLTNMEVSQLENADEYKDKDFKVAGMVSKFVVATGKNGNQYCRMTVEDYNGSYEFSFFGSDFDKYRNYYYENNMILISGKITTRYKDSNQYVPRVNNIVSLQDAQEKMIKRLLLKIDIDRLDDKFIDVIENLLTENKGDIPVYIKTYDTITGTNVEMKSKGFMVDINNNLITNIKAQDIDYQLS